MALSESEHEFLAETVLEEYIESMSMCLRTLEQSVDEDIQQQVAKILHEKRHRAVAIQDRLRQGYGDGSDRAVSGL